MLAISYWGAQSSSNTSNAISVSRFQQPFLFSRPRIVDDLTLFVLDVQDLRTASGN